MYKNGKYWHTSLMVNGKRISRSLRTKDKKIAKTRIKEVQNELWDEIKNGSDKRKPAISTIKLVNQYRDYKRKIKAWGLSTQKTNKHVLNKWHKEGGVTAQNKSTIASQSKIVNGFMNWANRRYKVDFKILPIREGDGRERTYSKKELDLLFNSKEKCMWGKYEDSVSMHGCPSVIPKSFLKFAYYTGARQGELLNIESVQDGFMIASGKRDRRVVKLTIQAINVIKNVNIKEWNWEPHHITDAFFNYTKKINIENAHFKDLRRTFGLNFLLQGGTMYQLSKLLGHKNLKTTERHYAPLMAIHVKNFTL